MVPKLRCAFLVLALVVSACGGGGDPAPLIEQAAASKRAPAGGGFPGGGSTGGVFPGGGSTGGEFPSGGLGSGGPGHIAPAPIFDEIVVATAALTATPASPAVARLADGGAVTVWVSANALLAQQVASDGSLVGGQLTVATLEGAELALAVAGLAGGDWVVAWISQIRPVLTMLAVPYGLQTRRFSATGALVQDRQIIAEFTSFDPHLQIEATPDGGYIIGWAASPILTAPQGATFLRFAADGSRLGSTAGAPIGDPGPQSRVRVVPLADGTFVAAWLQAQSTAASTSYSIWTQHFDATSNALRAPRQLEPSIAGAAFPFAAAPAGDDRTGVVWLSDPGSDMVSWQSIDTSGGAVTDVRSQRFAPVVDQLEAVGAKNGWIAFVQVRTEFSRGVNAQVTALSIAADGSVTTSATFASRSLQSISPTTGATTGPAAAGFSVSGSGGGHYVAAYESGTAGGRNVLAVGR